MQSNTIRTRWAAIGAAIAVTLGAGGVGITHAVSDSADGPVSAYFPIEPCRLADTRPGSIGPDATMDFGGWGSVGDCTLPNGISGLALNVTAVGATAQTNLRFFPEGGSVPSTANLNPTPGAPATPNAVNVALNDTTGEFSVYNRFGAVAVVIDVMGYYDDHTHDDRYEPLLEVYTGQLAARYPADTGFLLVGASFPQPLPAGVANLDLEYLATGTSADCPGIGQSTVEGKLCVYAYNNLNIDRVNLSGESEGENRRHGFSLDVFPSNGAANGFFLASWAYRVPTS